jgi:glycosyltransferase involved in cell wall biosynthesis
MKFSPRTVGATLGGLVLWPFLYAVILALWLLPKRKKKLAQSSFKVLVTGRVDSRNWSRAHLVPLARTTSISELLLVVDGTVTGAPNAQQFPVPRLFGWLKPRAIVRSLWVIWVAVKERPHIIMAYAFFPPGIFSLLAARLCGGAAIMQLAGGPAEIEWGSIGTEEQLMPAFLTRRLIPLCHRVCKQFDAIIVRGKKALDYTQKYCRPEVIEVLSGAVDPDRFHVNGDPRTVDIAFIGRIVGIKQPDHVCEVIHRVVKKRPLLRAVVAGTGPLLEPMKRQVAELGIERNVRFVGHVERVERLLTRSRVFLLTSRSEGLSIAMIEAMIAGAVPVVPDVGDLSELVIDGKTGWCVQSGNFEEYADKICALLDDRNLWEKMSREARDYALMKNGVESVARHWQTIFSRTVAPSAHAQ